jgi:uncharacterized protein (DUF305 family)
VALALFFSDPHSERGRRRSISKVNAHHSGAILMCDRAPIQDQEIKSLCKTIIEGQQKEIDQMKTILARKA